MRLCTVAVAVTVFDSISAEAASKIPTALSFHHTSVSLRASVSLRKRSKYLRPIIVAPLAPIHRQSNLSSFAAISFGCSRNRNAPFFLEFFPSA